VGAALILAPYGCTFFGLTLMSGVPEARSVLARVRRLKK